MRDETSIIRASGGRPPSLAFPIAGLAIAPIVGTCRRSRMLVAAVAVTLPAVFVTATVQAQFFTVAPGGPSGYPSDAVFGPAFGPPSPFVPPFGVPVLPPAGFGPTVILAPPLAPLPAGPLGMYVVDALSSGNEAGNRYMFSVAAGSVGFPGSQVMTEAMLGTGPSQMLPPGVPGPGVPMEQMGDVFVSRTNFVTGGTHPIFGTPALAGPLMAGPIYRDEFTLGLNVGDDLSSLVMRMPMGGPAMLKYSIGAAGAVPPPYSPADIISPALPFGAAWAPAGALGLMPADDIDALITQDIGPAAMYMPGIDSVVFSLAPGSPTLAAIGATPSDLLMAMPFGLPTIYIPGVAFGLGPMDNLDALDVFPGQAGDFTGDERVDARDYVAWRNSLGMPVMPAGSGADGNGDGIVNGFDYAIWRANFGMGAGPGAGAALSAGLTSISVPEPCGASLLMIVTIIPLGFARLRHKRCEVGTTPI